MYNYVSSIKTPSLLNIGDTRFSFRFRSGSFARLYTRDEVVRLMRDNRSRYYIVALFVDGRFHRSIVHIPLKIIQTELDFNS